MNYMAWVRFLDTFLHQNGTLCSNVHESLIIYLLCGFESKSWQHVFLCWDASQMIPWFYVKVNGRETAFMFTDIWISQNENLASSAGVPSRISFIISDTMIGVLVYLYVKWNPHIRIRYQIVSHLDYRLLTPRGNWFRRASFGVVFAEYMGVYLPIY